MTVTAADMVGGLEDQEGASRFLKVSKRKLQSMRAEGTGPRWFRIDRQVRYPVEELHRWVAEQIAKCDGDAA